MSRLALPMAAAAALLACKQDRDAPAREGKEVKVPVKPLAAQAVPLSAEQEAHAKQLVRDSCLACHSNEMMEQQRLTPAQWTANVKKMQGWGAPMEGDEPQLLTAYLSQRYHVDAGPFELAAADPAHVAAAIAPTPDGPFAGGDAKRGLAVYTSSCASCHGPDARGAAVGTNLVDRPVLYRAAEFAEVVKKGRNRMPETPNVRDADIASLLAYLRSLRG
jgi:mono/diheme cytochrome c family protein